MSNDVWTIQRLLSWTEQYFRDKGVESPRLDGEVLLSHALKKDRVYLYADFDQPLKQEELDVFRPMVQARVNGKSVAAITGEKEFMGLPFSVSEHVLIPRPDTEILVEDVLSLYERDAAINILDVCVGPGTILLSLLHYLPQATGMGLDISKQALQQAEINKAKFDLSDRAQLALSDVFTGLTEIDYKTFNVLVSNPPYITTADMETLPADVKAEPAIALHGGTDGLDFYRKILADGHQYVKTGGYLVVEIGVGQEQDVATIAESVGAYEPVTMLRDLNGIIRTLRWKVR